MTRTRRSPKVAEKLAAAAKLDRVEAVRKPLLLWLTEAERNRLTTVAAKKGISRAALIRSALEGI